MRTETEERFADGRTSTISAFQVLRRYDSGWRIVIHSPGIVDFVVEITEVLPDSQAQHVGLQCGDRVVSYADEPITMPDQLIHLTAAKVAERNLPLIIARGNEKLEVTVDGGQLGTRLAGYFVPAEDSVTPGPEVDGIVAVFHDLMAAVRERGWSAQRDFCWTGAVVLAPEIDGLTVLSGNTLMQRFDEEAPNLVRESGRVSDIRVIADGHVAFAGVTVSIRMQNGKEMRIPQTHILFNDSGTWQIIAMFPGYFAIHPSVPVQCPVEPVESD